MPTRCISALFSLIIFITALAGCGKTGPLYLPDEKTVPEQDNTTN